MAEYIEREAVHKVINGTNSFSFSRNVMIEQMNTIPAADVVSRVAFDQVVWERDTAMEQLKEHGIPFGGKANVVAVVRCKDCKYYGDTAYGDMCKRWEDWLPVEDDDFCSYGEKSGGDDE